MGPRTRPAPHRLATQAPPALVTVARSVGDGYCPAELAERLEEAVVAMAGRLYGAPRVIRDVDGTRAFVAEDVDFAFPRRKRGR